MSELVSKGEYAKRKGWSAPYLSKLIKQGKVPTIGKKIDPEAADAALAKRGTGKLQPRPKVNAVKRAAPKSDEKLMSDEDFMAARTRREIADANLKEVELAQRRSELVDREETVHEWTALISNAKSKLLQFSAKLAQRLTGVESTAQIKAIVDADVYDVLTELAKGA